MRKSETACSSVFPQKLSNETTGSARSNRHNQYLATGALVSVEIGCEHCGAFRKSDDTSAAQLHTPASGAYFFNVAAAHPDLGSEGGHVVHGIKPSSNFNSRRSGRRPSSSPAYIANPMPIWRIFERHAARLLDPLALANAGSNSDATMAMIAITTSSSIKVKPPRRTVGNLTWNSLFCKTPQKFWRGAGRALLCAF